MRNRLGSRFVVFYTFLVASVHVFLQKLIFFFRVVPTNSGFSICLGKDRLSASVTEFRRLTCILCQETEVVKYNGRPLVCVGFIQQFVFNCLANLINEVVLLFFAVKVGDITARSSLE